jgi:hypothetical protein
MEFDFFLVVSGPAMALDGCHEIFLESKRGPGSRHSAILPTSASYRQKKSGDFFHTFASISLGATLHGACHVLQTNSLRPDRARASAPEPLLALCKTSVAV